MSQRYAHAVMIHHASRPPARKLRTFLTCSSVLVSAYLASVWLLGPYTEGDQIWYTALYYELAGAPLELISDLQYAYTSSSELVFGIIMWVGATLGIGKTEYVSGFNALLFVLGYLALRRHQTPIAVTILLSTNYYVLVLLTAAERLKFAYLFLILAAVLSGRITRMAALALAPLTHFQTLIVYVAGLGAVVANAVSSRSGRSRVRLAVGFAVLAAGLGGAVFLMFGEQISSKVAFYSGSTEGLAELANLSLLLAVGMVATSGRLRMLAALVPVMAAAFVLGSERVNMVGFTIVAALLIAQRRAHHPLFLAVLCYFSYKSIGFVERIMEYGNGFASGL